MIGYDAIFIYSYRILKVDMPQLNTTVQEVLIKYLSLIHI